MLMAAGAALYLVAYAGNKDKLQELGAELGSGYK